ncbi:transporter substrate-binding protein [bacterium]|nr:transporter substrate-binding protein [bacterium]
MPGRYVLAWILLVLLGVAGAEWWLRASVQPIKVGLLHSRSGAMAISESSMIDAEILAIEQINAAGGLMGRPVEYIVADGKSDWPTFAREAERLIRDEKVAVIFGCWTSASRKTVLPVIESNDHLLIYPMAYEGLEYSQHVICTGAAPNQQITPSISWAIRNLGAKRFYLVGSDYIWPHCVNEISKDILKSVGADLAGESYLLFGTDDVKDVVADIVKTAPDVIISTVVGDTNRYFYAELGKAGIRSDKIPVISFAIAEDELRALLKNVPAEDLVGHYSAWNYFQTIDSPANKAYLEALRARYGPDKVANDVMTASYNSVKLWAQAVVEAESTDVDDVVNAIGRQSLAAPEGIVTVDSWTNHTWRPVYIAKARSDALFDIVWSSGDSIRPVPFPITRSKRDWEELLRDLYAAWGNSWANPGDREVPPIKSKRPWVVGELETPPALMIPDAAKPASNPPTRKPESPVPPAPKPPDNPAAKSTSPSTPPVAPVKDPEESPARPDPKEPVIDETHVSRIDRRNVRR